MNRRNLLKASVLAAPFLHIRPARADKGELVVVSWGGDYDTAIRDLVVPAFQKSTGYSVKMDAPPENAKVKAMVQSGNIAVGRHTDRHPGSDDAEQGQSARAARL